MLAGGAALALALSPGAARAQDKTLSEGRPLLHLGDAFPIAPGEGAILAGTGVTLARGGGSLGFLPIAVQYGLLPQVQVALGTVLTSAPHATSDPAHGDLTAGIRVNFGRETYFVPSFAAQLTVTMPSGVDSNATDYTLTGYATKTLTHSLYGHVNASLGFSDNVARDERLARYALSIGASYTVPELAAVLVAADVFTVQARRIGESNATGVEAGVRVRITPSMYWDIGIGSELAGPRDRAAFYATTGLTFGFNLD
jgi:hypothetical protein